MMKKIKNILLVLLCIVMFCGCGKKSVIHKETENDVKMPSIVFSFFKDGSEVSEEKNPYFMTFIDSKGNIYSGDNVPENKLYYGTMEEDYNNGSLFTGFEIIGKTDSNKVREMYKLLCKTIEDGYSGLAYDYDATCLDVESAYYSWYALYYDDEGKLCCLDLHEYSENEGSIYSGNSDIETIYEWFADLISDH